MVTWTVVRGSSVASSGVSEETIQAIENLIEIAGEEWAKFFQESNVDIRVQLNFEDNEEDNVLATGGGGFEFLGVGALGNPAFQTSSAIELFQGVDNNPGAVDINLTFNLDNINEIFFDDDPTTDGDVPFSQFDGYTIILHEIGHGLGFLGFNDFAGDVFDTEGSISTYDNFITFAGDVPFFTGSAARAVFGGDVPLTIGNNAHLGNIGGPGSQLTGGNGDLLQASISRGQRLDISSLDIAILADTGIPKRVATGSRDQLFGFERENDDLNGLQGNDLINGQGGNDTLTGGRGADRLIGGGGSDTFVLLGNDANDVISDFGPADTLDLRGVPANFTTRAQVIAAASEQTLNGFSGLFIDTGDDTGVLLQGVSLNQFVANANILFGPLPLSATVEAIQIGGVEAEEIEGSAGNNLIDGGNGNDFLNGGAGADTIAGGVGDDQIFAGSGDDSGDTFIGGAGNDVIGGGVGNDLIIGGGFSEGASVQTTAGLQAGGIAADGADTLFGGSGNDTIIGGSFLDVVDNGIFDNNSIFGSEEAIQTGTAANTIFAGTGNDSIFGAAGADILGGGAGDDDIDAGDGDDTIFGGQGDDGDVGLNDSINAGNGNDQIFSSGGNDSVFGGAGNDEIFSGTGNDTVSGGSGDDTLFGGAGNDLFAGGDGADTFAFFAGNGDDIILDFDLANDTLDLSGTAFDFMSTADIQARTTVDEVEGVSGIRIDTGGGDSVFITDLNTFNINQIEVIF